MKSAQQQLTELQDRHDEFIKLEKSIRFEFLLTIDYSLKDFTFRAFESTHIF